MVSLLLLFLLVWSFCASYHLASGFVKRRRREDKLKAIILVLLPWPLSFAIPNSRSGDFLLFLFLSVPAGWFAWLFLTMVETEQRIALRDAIGYRSMRQGTQIRSKNLLPAPLSVLSGKRTHIRTDSDSAIWKGVLDDIRAAISDAGGKMADSVEDAEYTIAIHQFAGWTCNYEIRRRGKPVAANAPSSQQPGIANAFHADPYGIRRPSKGLAHTLLQDLSSFVAYNSTKPEADASIQSAT